MTNLIVQNLQFVSGQNTVQDLHGRSSAGITATSVATSQGCHGRFLADKDAIVATTSPALLSSTAVDVFYFSKSGQEPRLACLVSHHSWWPCIAGKPSLSPPCSILQKPGKTKFFSIMAILPCTD